MSLSRPFAIVSLAALAGCGYLTAPDVPEVEVGTVALPANAALGDTVRITIDIVNGSDRSVEVIESHCNSDFMITNASGARFYPAERVYCSLALYAPTPVAAGTTHRVNGFTTGRVIPEGSVDDAIMLPTGTYRVQPSIVVIRGDEVEVRTMSRPAVVVFR